MFRQGSLLRLKSATARDSGLYKCKASNVLGVANSTGVQVVVNAGELNLVQCLLNVYDTMKHMKRPYTTFNQ